LDHGFINSLGECLKISSLDDADKSIHGAILMQIDASNNSSTVLVCGTIAGRQAVQKVGSTAALMAKQL
jgi:hypothetical protein